MQTFIETLVKNIIESRHLPKVQVERQLSPILEIFIEALINKWYENKMPKPSYKLIAGEFPLQKANGKNLQCTNIDFLFYNETENSLLFLEFKTCSDSFNLEQYEIYLDIVSQIEQKNAGFLHGFLSSLKNKKYKKYAFDINGVFPKEKWQEIKNADILYLAPEKMKDRNWGDKNRAAIEKIEFMHFNDLPQDIEHKHQDAWKIIVKGLRVLDGN